jgi:hypothetical protein
VQRYSIRHIALVCVLALGAGASWLRWRHPGEVDSQRGDIDGLRVFHVDVAGWYQTTPHEAVVLSRYDLAAGAFAGSLPFGLPGWRGVDLGASEEIERWYGTPDSVLRRRYENASGDAVWITAISSRGAKSFRIFEHTPQICYPSSGWVKLADDTHTVLLGRGAFPVRRGLFEQGETRHVVYHWYQWDTPTRDAAQGITSWQLAADASSGVQAAEGLLSALLEVLFYDAIPWHRF